MKSALRGHAPASGEGRKGLAGQGPGPCPERGPCEGVGAGTEGEVLRSEEGGSPWPCPPSRPPRPSCWLHAGAGAGAGATRVPQVGVSVSAHC